MTPLLRCDRRIDATTVSSMDGHIWRWAGIIPPGFEPEFEPRLAHYSKCYTYTWFGSALQNTYISCLGHDDASSDSFDGANACAVLPRPVSGAFHAERVLGPLFVRPRYSGCPVCDLLWVSAWLQEGLQTSARRAVERLDELALGCCGPDDNVRPLEVEPALHPVDHDCERRHTAAPT